MKFTRSYRIAAGLLATLLLLWGLVACKATDTAAETETGELETLPDLTDTRTPTALDPSYIYAERLHAVFGDATPAPATDFTYTVLNGTVTVTAYVGEKTVAIIPETIEDMPVVAIARTAFAGKEDLRGLYIPDTVTDIEVGALADCRALTTLRTPMAAASGRIHFGSLFGAETYETNGSYVPDKLVTLLLTQGTRIEPYAFYDCDLEVVLLPATLTEIGEFAFYGNEKLLSVSPAHTALTAVGERAFANCRSLLSMKLPATVTTMGFAMLEGCAALTDLTIPFVGAARNGVASETETETGEEEEETLSADHLAYIFGARAYVHASGYLPASLVRVTLLAGCGDIPANAFFECDAIREVVIPDGVTAIGHRAFYGCERLATVTLPDSVTAIGDDAFNGCIRLASVDVGTGLKTLGVQAFMGCVSLPEMTLPASVKAIPNAAFAGCVSLEALTAPGVTEVGAQAFRHCDKLLGWEQ